MNRYIDADALIAEIKMDIEAVGLQEKMVFYRINDAPSIDIVRCKECKYWEKYDDWSACNFWSGDPYEQAATNADDFCNYGERRK